jgi:TolB-like protein
MTHYVTDNLRLRNGDTLSSLTITVLPRYTALRIIETGKSETIDGITASWIKIATQSGYTGWCFSGYVRRIESNVAEDIASSFANRESGTFPQDYDRSKKDTVASTDVIQSANGYYIQQAGRRFQSSGHAPEILTLSVERGNVYIREIDMVNGQTITRNEIALQFNGSTYGHNRTKLEIQNGKIQIIYLEHIPQEKWLGTWEYDDPYTFAGNLNVSMPDKVRRLTTDYLSNFAGRYVFDSYKIIRSENRTIDINVINNTIIQIAYSQEKKCLTIPFHDLCGFYDKWGGDGKRQIDFVETTADEPFWWTYGEGVGFSEDRFYFYKGGIAFTYESSGVDFDDNHEIISHEYIKYVVFFRKE